MSPKSASWTPSPFLDNFWVAEDAEIDGTTVGLRMGQLISL